MNGMIKRLPANEQMALGAAGCGRQRNDLAMTLEILHEQRRGRVSIWFAHVRVLLLEVGFI